MQSIKTEIDETGRYYTSVTLSAPELMQIEAALMKNAKKNQGLLRKIAVALAMQDAAQEITTATPGEHISPDVLDEEAEAGEP